MLALQIVCLTSLGLVAYCYAGYPVLLVLYTKLRGKAWIAEPVQRAPEEWPFVSLVIAAYKEERIILDRLHNALRMDYPADRIEILIGCDGQEDNTGELVRTVNDSRVRLLQFPQRRGKPSVLNDCVASTRGSIIAFSDANTFYETDAMKKLVAHFDRPRVGGVVGQLDLIDPETGKNVDGMYWKLENVLKKCEGRIGALLGANGAIYAIRRELWQPIEANTIVDDFVIGMRVHLQGRELVFEENAVAKEESAPSIDAEFHRRTRIGAGGFQSLVWLAPLLSPAYGAIAWAFWSHKVLRWFAPMFLLTGFVANLFLFSSPVFQAVLGLQLAGYLAAWLGTRIPARNKAGKMLRLATMFCSMNAALMVGFWRCLRKSQSGAWKRTARTAELAEPRELTTNAQ